MRRSRVVALLAAVLVVVGCASFAGTSQAASQQTLFGEAVPGNPSEADTAKVELGVQFKAAVAGQVTGVRFYKGTGNTGTHTGSLWTGTTRTRTGTFTGETASGWQTLTFSSPVSIAANSVYTASYLAPKGRYAADNPYAFPKVSGDLTALKGTYRYGGGYPDGTWQTSNYWVDVVFVPNAVAPPTTTTPSSSTTSAATTPVTSSPVTTASPTTSTPDPTPTTTATTTTVPPVAPTLRAVDGGAGYYGQWSSNTVPTDPGFFPIGVWMEQADKADRIKTLGINTIINSVNGLNPNIMNVGALEDEADMWAGGGSAAWTGNFPGQGAICSPSNAKCGFTIMETHQAGVAPGQMRYANYGKGISFETWEPRSSAAQFVNQYQDVVSADLYWATDPELCQASQGGNLFGTNAQLPDALCHQASNYGRTVDHVRGLVAPAGSKPVWNYVELDQPIQGSTLRMTQPKLKAAVWSSLIHEARGIVYFNHNFAGDCQSQHVLFDCDQTLAPFVTSMNAQITGLAPVLNAPTVDGLTTVTGGADVLAKASGGDLYLFAGSTQQATQQVSIGLSCGATGSAEVLDESRSVPVVDGKITDTFADSNAVHLYRIPGGATACGF